jgi:hypothetical protein
MDEINKIWKMNAHECTTVDKIAILLESGFVASGVLFSKFNIYEKVNGIPSGPSLVAGATYYIGGCMDKSDVKIRPECLGDVPVGVCSMACESRRVVKKTGMIECHGGKGVTSVLPLMVCVPWVQSLLDSIGELEVIVEAKKDLVDEKCARIVVLENEVETLKKEVTAAVSEAVKAKSEVNHCQGEIGVFAARLASMEQLKNNFEEKSRTLWDKLKGVQEYSTERKKYAERIEVQEEKVRALVERLDGVDKLLSEHNELRDNFELVNKRNVALTERIRELEGRSDG